jgi:radical SAM superfamily enzyme YgiQ (UPF0313 family)
MRVLLVKPNSKADSIVPPLGLGYLATQIRDRHEVQVLNCLLQDLDLQAFLRRARRFRPDVVGLQIYTSDRNVSRDYLRGLSQLSPRPLLVAGGPHPSSLPQRVLEDFAPELDYAFAGEAEVGFARFLECLQSGAMDDSELAEIPGLIRRTAAGVAVNPSEFLQDLERYGEPSWDLLRPETYPPSPYAAFARKLPVAPLVASRGCASRCTFCAAGCLSGYRVRYRSPQAVLAEIERLIRVHGVREIQFADDNFTLNREVVTEICEQMIARGLDVPWSCPNGVRLDSLDPELLRLMKRSGCYSLAVGIETGSKRLMKKIHKGINLDQVRDRIALIREAGILAVGYFILGFPTETPAERQQTIDLALSLPLDLANFMLCCPLPGTPIYDEVVSGNRFIDAEWYTFTSTIHVPEGETPISMRKIQRSAFLRFYLRPRQLALLAGGIRSWRHLMYISQRINRWLFKKSYLLHEVNNRK